MNYRMVLISYQIEVTCYFDMDYVSGTVSLVHECQHNLAIIHSSQPYGIARYLPGNDDIFSTACTFPGKYLLHSEYIWYGIAI